jgi:uncharacterized protein
MHESFEGDEAKNLKNKVKHGVSFEEAMLAFADPNRLIFEARSTPEEERWFCVGDIGTGIVTVRFTYRGNKIRIFGAGYWRKNRIKYLEAKEKI